MNTDAFIAGLSDEAKNRIIRDAIEVCRWRGWLSAVEDSRIAGGRQAVERLTATVQEQGVELESYT